MTKTKDDHDRGCQGREYMCTCGYDDERDAESERLRGALCQLRARLVDVNNGQPGSIDLELIATIDCYLGISDEPSVQRPCAHWTCKTHGDFDATRAVGCPECMRLAREALRQAETVMMIVEPRSHKAEYLESLDKIRAVIGRDEADDATENSMRDSDR